MPTRRAQSTTVTRRTALGAAGALALFHVVPRHVLGGGQTPPSEKLRIAGIGVGGRGGADVRACASEAIVALVDVDESRAAGTFKEFPDANTYKDFRLMFDKEENNIDAVVIGAPDHIHAPAAMAAMKRGKHVYCEKPLTHTIYEARALTEAAKEHGVVTQMGNQGHAGEGLRETCEILHDGAIGKVTEVHGWSDRPIWPQGIDRPSGTPPVPNSLNWYLWLGPAPDRPYHSAYVPFRWRGWRDFGTGAMGDMAVHNLDPAFFCLDLDSPDWVEAESSGVNEHTWPEWQIITYHFPAKGDRSEIKMTWYDGKKFPDRPELDDPRFEGNKPSNGILFVGEKGSLMGGSHAGRARLYPESLRNEYEKPEPTLWRSPGHHREWIDACKKGDASGAWSNFGYSGPFTESLLVGNLAVILGKRIEWDAGRLKATNAPEADALINKEYREGWGLEEV